MNTTAQYFVTELVTPNRSGKAVILERFIAAEGRTRVDTIQVFWKDSSGMGDFYPVAYAAGEKPEIDYRACVSNVRNLTSEEKAEIQAILS